MNIGNWESLYAVLSGLASLVNTYRDYVRNVFARPIEWLLGVIISFGLKRLFDFKPSDKSEPL